MRYLLDTCSFVWLCAEPARLGARAIQALESADAEILLSDVSVLELALKWQAGKITLPKPPRAWIDEQARAWHCSMVALKRSAIYRSSELPALHRDPFDRLLVATAIEDGMTLITPDSIVQRYPVAWIW